jgi:hypothetical protein
MIHENNGVLYSGINPEIGVRCASPGRLSDCDGNICFCRL